MFCSYVNSHPSLKRSFLTNNCFVELTSVTFLTNALRSGSLFQAFFWFYRHEGHRPTPETTELKNLHVWVWNLLRNLWNQIHESEKPVKPWNSWNHKTQGIRTVLMKSLSPLSLLMKPLITKPTKPMKTTKPLKSQNSWNHETSKLWHLRKFRRPRSSKRFQVPCEQREILNSKKPLKSQNLWNHETSKV